MGACVSRSTATAAAAELRRVEAVDTAAMVMDLDGTMARVEAPVTVRAALGGDAWSCFVCAADELGFDAPARAMDAEEALRPGQLYFVLPLCVLRRPLSGQDMAALAVKASAALSSIGAGGLYTAAAAVSTTAWRKGRAGVETGKRRKQTSRVAPLVVVSGTGAYAPVVASGDRHRTTGKTTSKGGGGARRRAGVQRLSAILEGSE
ncbi:uncharacterized protein LOC121055297 [Oryza brachyantha]|uniref:uncharacterized protein LOC121055297 n=1 Tax=Oryza brachyantha TaxID=4533 RepID=UPI001AD95A57|nr:uncharacterized protein LOC121055297 [Oryza brachyantha]